MRLPRPIAALLIVIVAFAGGGCVALERDNNHFCAVVVIADGGQRIATPEQVIALQRLLEPYLAARGWVPTPELNKAKVIARVELTRDPTDPMRDEYVVRGIQPNPVRDAPSSLNYPDPVGAELRRDLKRDESEFSVSK